MQPKRNLMFIWNSKLFHLRDREYFLNVMPVCALQMLKISRRNLSDEELHFFGKECKSYIRSITAFGK